MSSESTPSLERPDSFGIVVVADLDKMSKDADTGTFFSYLQFGTLQLTRSPEGDLDGASVEWGAIKKFSTTEHEGGRGFELSELVWYRGRLLTVDDRTGVVYHLQDFDGDKAVVAVPELTVMAGDGTTGKRQKHEWATVKDGELYMGSHGTPIVDRSGNVLSDRNLWISILDAQGNLRHEDWTPQYDRIREALGCDCCGYVTHEAIEWSAVHRKWFILPRRVSVDAFNPDLDEVRGANKLVIANEDFSSCEVVDVGRLSPLRGFSSLAFVPHTNDSVIVAIKSIEISSMDLQTAYVMVFDLKGKILMDETELPGGYKYEGIAFDSDWACTK